MNLVADESVDHQIVERLGQDGHSAISVAELSPSIPDDEVLEQANATGSLLLTADKDFGELVFRQRRIHSGVVLLHLSGLNEEDKAHAVSEVFREHATELNGAFTVVSPGMVRIRGR